MRVFHFQVYKLYTKYSKIDFFLVCVCVCVCMCMCVCVLACMFLLTLYFLRAGKRLPGRIHKREKINLRAKTSNVTLKVGHLL